MFSWNTFPYSDFNKVNLDWICRQISACGTFWTCSDASLVIDPDRGTGVSFYMADMTGPAGDAEPKQGDAVFYSLDSITYCAFIDDVVGAGGGNPEFLSFRIYRMTGPQGEPGESGGGGTGLTEDIKQALLQLAQKVAYIDANGQDYYQDLYDALYEVEPPATLVSIDAVYTQSGTVYDTDTLDSLKTDIVVTATYSDSSTATIPAADYTLSGSLTVGTSTITVSYGGQTDTFTVTVTENPAPPVTLVSIDAVYTQGGTVYDTDTLDSLKTDLVVTATYSDSSTAVIPAADYTLSGTLTVGSSVITVSYGGKFDTFTVTVTAYIVYTYYDYIKNTSEVSTSKTLVGGEGIHTDIQLSTDNIIEFQLKFTSTLAATYNCGIMGTRSGQTGTKQFGLFVFPTSGKLGYWYANTDTANTFNPLTVNTLHTIKVQPVGISSTYPTTATINVDGTDYDTGSTATGQTWSAWFGIFHYAISATKVSEYQDYCVGAMIGEIVIKDSSNNVLHDLKPAYNGTYYGFHDTVTDTFYYDSAYSAEYACGSWGV